MFDSIRPLLDDVLKGVNGTVFAYGQTSAGKSHTMLGPDGGASQVSERYTDIDIEEPASLPACLFFSLETACSTYLFPCLISSTAYPTQNHPNPPMPTQTHHTPPTSGDQDPPGPMGPAAPRS